MCPNEKGSPADEKRNEICCRTAQPIPEYARERDSMQPKQAGASYPTLVLSHCNNGWFRRCCFVFVVWAVYLAGGGC